MTYAVSVSAGAIQLEEVLVRIAEATASAAVIADECQAHVGTLLARAGDSLGDHADLQRLDALSQTLHGLTMIIARTSAHAPSGSEVLLDPLVKGIGLKALADRITGAARPALGPAGELDLF
jgi:hypothetical protein